jgi:hypothetical protein
MIFSSGCNVSQLNDKSGFGTHNLVQESSSNQPRFNTFINNTAALNFTGSNIFLSTITTNFPNILNNNSFSHYTVARATTTIVPGFSPTQPNIFSFTNSNNNLYSVLGLRGNPTNILYFWQSNGIPPRGQLNRDLNNTSNFIVQTPYDKNTSNMFLLYEGGTLTTTTNITPLSNITRFRLGQTNFQFGGAIGEFISFSNYYNTSNDPRTQQLEGYLAWKWGMTSELSNNHPYKRRPPT